MTLKEFRRKRLDFLEDWHEEDPYESYDPEEEEDY